MGTRKQTLDSSLVITIIAFVLIPLTQARDSCYGPVVELDVTDSSQKDVLKSFGVRAGFGSNLSIPLSSLKLVVSAPLDACGPVTTQAEGAALLVIRGTCAFTDKVRAAAAASASAVLIYNNQTGCVTPGFEPNTTADLADSGPVVVSIPHDLGLRLSALTRGDAASSPAEADAAARTASGGAAAGGPVFVSLRLADVPLVDSGAVVLAMLAVGTVVVGSLWSAADHWAAGGRRGGGEEQDALLHPSDKPPSESEVVDLTPRAAVAFVVVASAMLLLLYFLLNRVFFFVLLGLFCLASVQSQTVLYAALLRTGVLPAGKRNASVQLPLVGACPLAVAASLPVAVAVAVVWAVERNEEWAWVLQDLQGVALLLLVLRTLRVPSLKVATILLPACLLYDVFWVFIQPLLFGNGKSVMVEVAMGGSSGEFIPMLLRVPHFGMAGLGGSSLLGFGDVILPGMLVAYLCRVDVDMDLRGSGTRPGPADRYLSGGGAAVAAGGGLRRSFSYILRSYFVHGVLSYAAGLGLTYAALAYSWFGDQGQPALLYLVPCTLCTALFEAAVRGHLAALWRGEVPAGGGAGILVFRGLADAGEDHESDPGRADGDVEAAVVASRDAGVGRGGVGEGSSGRPGMGVRGSRTGSPGRGSPGAGGGG